MAELLRMPEISANVVEAVLSEWPLPENASFSAGDPIATVETDKAVVDVPAESDGVLLRTLVEPGKSVAVGTPMAVVVAPGEQVDDVDALVARLTGEERPRVSDEPSPAGAREVSQNGAAEVRPGGAAEVGLGGAAEVGLGGAAEVGLGGAAEVGLGGAAEVGLGGAREVGQGGEGEVGQGGESEVGRSGGAHGLRDLGADAVPSVESVAARIFASPLARRIARENGLDVGDIRGTGPGGRIVRDDVRRLLADRTAAQPVAAAAPATVPVSAPSAAAPATVPVSASAAAAPATVPVSASAAAAPATVPVSASAAAAPQTLSSSEPSHAAGSVPAAQVDRLRRNAAASYRDIPHSRMRRAIATRLAESNRETPVFTIRGSARVDALLALREDLNAATDVRISVNDFVVAAAARAHATVPGMNVIWMPDAVRQFDDVDIAVAVATDSGLVTPVVRGVQRMTISTLARAGADLVGRARTGKLRQDELEGGTLTVTNLGVFGTEDFSAVINPPQAAILAVGAARQEAVVTEGDLGVATVLRVTLSVDHRPVDGATAAKWMVAFLTLLESPLRILA